MDSGRGDRLRIVLRKQGEVPIYAQIEEQIRAKYNLNGEGMPQEEED